MQEVPVLDVIVIDVLFENAFLGAGFRDNHLFARLGIDLGDFLGFRLLNGALIALPCHTAANQQIVQHGIAHGRIIAVLFLCRIFHVLQAAFYDLDGQICLRVVVLIASANHRIRRIGVKRRKQRLDIRPKDIEPLGFQPAAFSRAPAIVGRADTLIPIALNDLVRRVPVVGKILLRLADFLVPELAKLIVVKTV